MPGPVQERRQEHVAGRAGRRGSHICQMGLYHRLGATGRKEQRIGVAYLLNALGFVWSLMVVLLLSEPLEVTGRNLLFADPERASTWAVQLCHDWSTSGLARRQTSWWWVSFTAENYGTGDLGCYRSQLEVWQVASGSNVILGIWSEETIILVNISTTKSRQTYP